MRLVVTVVIYHRVSLVIRRHQVPGRRAVLVAALQPPAAVAVVGVFTVVAVAVPILFTIITAPLVAAVAALLSILLGHLHHTAPSRTIQLRAAST
jgi:hypothetical protein